MNAVRAARQPTPTERAEQAQAALAAFAAADATWTVALTRAFGSAGRDRRYDMDRSSHPAECREAHAAFEAARQAHDAAWQASFRLSALPATQAQPTIIRDTSGQLYAVRESADHPQAWIGSRVKRAAGGYVPVAKARETLVRKAASVVVQGPAS